MPGMSAATMAGWGLLALGLVFLILAWLMARVSRWGPLQAAYPSLAGPPPSAHRASNQTLWVGRSLFPGLVHVAVSDDSLWLGFHWPLRSFQKTICVPLSEVTLYTGEDWASGGARMRLAAFPDLILTLGGDGAQMVIARVG